MAKETERKTIEIEKGLWHEVGIACAILGITKREFTNMALKEKLERIKKEQK